MEPINPCLNNPCGPFSRCEAIGNFPSCSCLPNYFGSPPNCRQECVLNYDCPNNKACIRNHCIDPCQGICAVQAKCSVINHIPVCSCHEGFTGNAFSACYPIPNPRNFAYIYIYIYLYIIIYTSILKYKFSLSLVFC